MDSVIKFKTKAKILADRRNLRPAEHARARWYVTARHRRVPIGLSMYRDQDWCYHAILWAYKEIPLIDSAGRRSHRVSACSSCSFIASLICFYGLLCPHRRNWVTYTTKSEINLIEIASMVSETYGPRYWKVLPLAPARYRGIHVRGWW